MTIPFAALITILAALLGIGVLGNRTETTLTEQVAGEPVSIAVEENGPVPYVVGGQGRPSAPRGSVGLQPKDPRLPGVRGRRG